MSTEIRALADSVQEIVRLLTPLVDRLPTIAGRIATSARALDADPTNSSAESTLRSALDDHRALLTPVLDYLEIVDSAGVELALSRAESNYDALATLLRTHMERLNRQLVDATSTYQRELREQGLRAQLWAIRYSGRRSPTQVHIEGYDNLPAGDPNPVDKLGFTRTPAEQAVYDTSINAHRKLVTVITESASQLRNLKGAIDSLARSVMDGAREIKATLDSLPTRQVLSDLAEAVGQQSPQVRDRLRGLANLVATVDSLRALVMVLTRGLRVTSDPSILLDQLAAVRKSFDRADVLVTRLAGLGRELEALETAVRVSGQQLVGEIRSELDSVQHDSLPRWRAAFPSLQRISRHYDSVQTRIDWFRNVLELAGFANTLGKTDVSVDPQDLITHSADDLRPGVLDLTRIDPLEGDRVLVTLRVFDPHSEQTLTEQTSTIHVRTYGWHRRWSGGLAFTSESYADGIFPGVSASWILHHRSNATMQADGSQRDGKTLWLDAGFGLTSVVITRNNDVELGIGPVVSVFGDALVGGAGYNLQRQHWYWMLSTPLLDLLNRVSNPGEPR